MPTDIPMTDVMKMVLEAEEQSTHLLEDAEAEAAKIGDEARRQAHELVQKLQHETAEQAHTVVETARSEAHEERQRQLAQAAREIESTVRLEDAVMASLTDALLRCVSGTS
jgi:vacuolar-type H+-ATPase subunit H